jgi:hypothetical protein
VPRNQVYGINGQAEIGVAVKLTFFHTLHETGDDSSNMYLLFLRDDLGSEFAAWCID